MHEIEFHKDADEEMKAAAAYYEKRVTGLGVDFLNEIEQGLNRIRQFPLLWSIYEGEYRRYLLKRFRYGLIYRIETEKIFIIAVAHLHRKPGYWKGRK
jgi:mRNA-degrading endonuclease RelE of RelBE toxin-antitoxin system